MGTCPMNVSVPPAVVSIPPRITTIVHDRLFAIIAFFITYLELLIHGNCC